jgi:hypothetical protein
MKEQSELDRVSYGSPESKARNKSIGLISVSAVPPREYRMKK